MKLFAQTGKLKHLSLFALLFTTIAFTSCSKDDDEEVDAQARIKVVNAVQGSGDVNLYLDNKALEGSAVAYNEASGYLATKEGDRKAQFRAGSDVKTDFNLKLDAGKYYTVYYTGTADASSNLVTEDDMSNPPSGKAKVRVVHVSNAASAVDLGVLGASSRLVTDLAYKASTSYQTVDPNTTFVLYSAGTANVALTMPTEIQAGKIYTIFVSGATRLTLNYKVVAQN